MKQRPAILWNCGLRTAAVELLTLLSLQSTSDHSVNPAGQVRLRVLVMLVVMVVAVVVHGGHGFLKFMNKIFFPAVECF